MLMTNTLLVEAHETLVRRFPVGTTNTGRIRGVYCKLKAKTLLVEANVRLSCSFLMEQLTVERIGNALTLAGFQ